MDGWLRLCWHIISLSAHTPLACLASVECSEHCCHTGTCCLSVPAQSCRSASCPKVPFPRSLQHSAESGVLTDMYVADETKKACPGHNKTFQWVSPPVELVFLSTSTPLTVLGWSRWRVVCSISLIPPSRAFFDVRVPVPCAKKTCIGSMNGLKGLHNISSVIFSYFGLCGRLDLKRPLYCSHLLSPHFCWISTQSSLKIYASSTT